MSASRVSRSLAPLAAAAALLLVSCGRSPTEPAPGATVHRTVSVVVRDSLGDPAADCSVMWISLFDSAGVADVVLGDTDAQGTHTTVLAAGGWVLSAKGFPSTGWVAGAVFQVSGPQRAAADTQVVRLTLHTQSFASGTVLLSGRTDHRGTLLSSGNGELATTDSTGAWSMAGLPPGQWSVTMYHAGFRLGGGTIGVAAPGSHVTVPAVTLVP